MSQTETFYFMVVSAPPLGWEQPTWSAEMRPPIVGEVYGFQCVEVKPNEDGTIAATLALIRLTQTAGDGNPHPTTTEKEPQ